MRSICRRTPSFEHILGVFRSSSRDISLFFSSLDCISNSFQIEHSTNGIKIRPQTDKITLGPALTPEETKVQIFGKEKSKLFANFSATKVDVTSVSISLSLSLSHLAHLTGAQFKKCFRASYNEKASAVLARRRSEILERWNKLFSFHLFCWKHLCSLSSYSRYFSTDSLALLFVFLLLNVSKKRCLGFFIRCQNLVAFKRRQDCLFVCLFILGRKLNRQNCLLKEVLREREEKEEKEKKKSN